MTIISTTVFLLLVLLQQVRWWSMVATPFLTFFLAGMIFSADTLYIIKLFLLTCVYIVAHTVGRTMFDEHLMSLLPLSVYIATKVWFYVTWLFYFVDTVSYMTTAMFLACSSLLWICFWKSWRGDPGIIRPTQEQRFRVSLMKFSFLLHSVVQNKLKLINVVHKRYE